MVVHGTHVVHPLAKLALFFGEDLPNFAQPLLGHPWVGVDEPRNEFELKRRAAERLQDPVMQVSNETSTFRSNLGVAAVPAPGDAGAGGLVGRPPCDGTDVLVADGCFVARVGLQTKFTSASN